MPHIVLRSSHDPIAIANRLKAAVRDELTGDTPRRVTGRGNEREMTLWVHRPRFRNDFKTVLAAQMTADGGGTLIEGRIGPPRMLNWFMGCWFAFVALFLLFGAFVLGLTDAPAAIGLPFLLIPLGMLAIGALILAIGLGQGRSDEADILRFLETTISARPVSSSRT